MMMYKKKTNCIQNGLKKKNNMIIDFISQIKIEHIQYMKKILWYIFKIQAQLNL